MPNHVFARRFGCLTYDRSMSGRPATTALFYSENFNGNQRAISKPDLRLPIPGLAASLPGDSGRKKDTALFILIGKKNEILVYD